MKKALSLILMLAMVFSALVPSMVLAADEIDASSHINVAAGKSYTTTAIYTTNGVQNWPDEGGITLTDGVKASADAGFSDPVWVGFNKQSADYDSSENGYGAVTVIDLGETTELSKVAFQAFGGDAGISVPYWINLYVSDDGENFTFAKYLEINPENAVAGVNAYELNIDVTARFVKVCFYGYGWIFIDEIEVFGKGPELFNKEINVNENALLTDGKTGYTGDWGEVGTGDVLLIGNDECRNMAMDVTLVYNLGGNKTIDSLALDFYHCAGVMIGYPEGKVTVEVSADGENYDVVGSYDIASAEVALGGYGTVTTLCEFKAVEAAYVKATFRVGSSTGVLGDSPADGKVFWEFAALAEVAVGVVEVEPIFDKVVNVGENALLTDGMVDFAGNWGEVGTEDVLLIGNDECKNMAMNTAVVYALGETKLVNSLSLSFYHCAGVMIGYPEGQILVEVSADGENYDVVGYYDIASAEVALGGYGTVTTTCEFKAVEAAYIKATFRVGSSTGVLGDTPSDGKVFWEFAALSEVSYTEEIPVEIPEGALKIDISHVNAYSWGAYNEMIIYGEGKNSTSEIAQGCQWWLAFKVENIDGVYTVTEIEGNGETKDMVAPADGFLLYCYSNDAASYEAASKLSVGATLYHANFDWTEKVASATAIGQLYFMPVNYGENVAIGKPVENATDRGSYNANLTDGVALGNLTYNAADWFGFYWNPGMDLEGNLGQNTNAINGLANPIVDLGGLYDITTVRVNLFTGNTSGITAPETVTLKVSADGVNFEEIEVRGFEWPESGASKVEWVDFTLPEGTTAQYVCLEMVMRTTFVFLNEIEVYGTEADVHKHNLVHVEAVEPGCHYTGNIEHWYCTDCETVWSDAELTQITNHMSVILPELGGEIVHVEAKAPTCYEDGNIEYWYCAECEQVWQDEARTQLTNFKNVIAPAAHTLLVHVDAVEPGCHFTGSNEHWICYACETVWADEALTQITNVKNVIIPELGGEVIHVEAVAPVCGVNGNIEHWYCEECGQVWQDEARTQLTNHMNVIVPALDHELVHVEAVEPGCHYDGNIEHWYCTVCETVWADEALTVITNHKSVILPAVGSEQLVHMDAVAPGCHYTGNVEYWICYECEQVWTDEALTQLTNIKNVILPELGGEVIHVEASIPTCGYEGNIEYWYCEECEQVWQDEARTQLTNIKNVIIPAVDHETVHIEAVAPGCHYLGNIEYWYCINCDLVWADEALTQITNHKRVILPELGGEVIHVDAKAPSCMEEGNIEYWYCADCEQVWQDEARTQLTNFKNVILGIADHNLVHIEAVEPGCHYTGNVEHWYCTVCDTVWADEALTVITNHKSVILPELGGEIIHVEAKDPTCSEEGNIEYWYCAECEQVWQDEARTQLTNFKNVLIGTADHDLVHIEAVAPGCHYTGNIEHWYCTVCETVWADEALTVITNHKSVILPELGGEVIHVEAKDPTCDAEGNIEYWYCAECEQVWQDEARTQLTNFKNVLIGTIAHEYDENGECVNCDATIGLSISVDLDKTEAQLGSTITVDVMLDRNSGFAHLSLDVLFDTDVFELVSVSNGAIIGNFAHGAHFVWSSADNSTETGVLVTLTLQVKNVVAGGNYDITVVCNEAWTETEEAPYVVLVSGGSISIETSVYGDANGDGKVDGADTVRLLQYLANIDKATNISSVEVAPGADTNGDGVINGKDLTRLLRHLANRVPGGESTVPLGPQ